MPGRAIRIMWPWARGLRWRGTEDDGLLARPDRPSRCTLPITELREMPPSSAAIWLADKPSAHSFLRSSTRSSVQFMVTVLDPKQPRDRIPTRPLANPRGRHRQRIASKNKEKLPAARDIVTRYRINVP